MLTFPSSFGCREASFRLSLPPAVEARLRELAGAGDDEVARVMAASLSAVGRDGLRSPGRGRRRRPHACARARSPRRTRNGAWAAGSSRPRRPIAAAPAARPRRARARAARCRRSSASTRETMFAELETRGVRFDIQEGPRRSRVKVGVPTEIKEEEYRVALTAVGARELAEHGHEVLIQKGAGEGSAIADSDYEAQGATDRRHRRGRLRRGRHGARRQGAAAASRSRCSAPSRPSSPTCTWRRLPS